MLQTAEPLLRWQHIAWPTPQQRSFEGSEAQSLQKPSPKLLARAAPDTSGFPEGPVEHWLQLQATGALQM